MLYPNIMYYEHFSSRTLMLDIPHETVISYFDLQVGPKVLISDLENQNTKREISIPEEQLTRLMDIHISGDFFIHYYDDKVTVNYCFSIKDPETRGGEHEFMASIIFNKDDKMSNQEYFSNIFSNMPELENWVKTVSNSIHKNSLIKNLLSTKRIRELDNQIQYLEVKNALISSLMRK